VDWHGLARRAQDTIRRRGDIFFVALVSFCKPLRAKQETKETKGDKTLQILMFEFP
jgi:hypothetical protein